MTITGEGWVILALSALLPIAVWFGIQIGRLRERGLWERAMRQMLALNILAASQAMELIHRKVVNEYGSPSTRQEDPQGRRRRVQS